jgi:uncharacterized membrane protein YqjE
MFPPSRRIDMHRTDDYVAPAPERVPERVDEERPLGELLRELSEETRTLIRQEVELAKTELSQKASDLARGAVFMGAGALILYIGVLALVAAGIIALAAVVPWWLSALIFGIAFVAIGAILVFAGIGRFRAATTPPEQTVQSLREDKEFIEDKVRR